MENLIKSILDIFRTHNILLYVVCIASGVISYNVFGVADLTGYAEIKSEYKNYIGLVFLLSGITIVVLCIRSIIAYTRQSIIDRQDQKLSAQNVEEKLNNLTNQEKAILLQYYIQDSETIWLPIQGQEVVELCNAGILTLASTTARRTRVGHAVLLKLTNKIREMLAAKHPDVFSDQYNKELVEDIICNQTPESVHVVNENRKLFGY